MGTHIYISNFVFLQELDVSLLESTRNYHYQSPVNDDTEVNFNHNLNIYI